jgi:hypothetical protein
MMHFDEFVRHVDAAIRAAATVDHVQEPQGAAASWSARSRSAVVALAPPQNVSVTLAGGAEAQATTWYPIDAALVPVVSKRIAGHLSEV